MTDLMSDREIAALLALLRDPEALRAELWLLQEEGFLQDERQVELQVELGETDAEVAEVYRDFITAILGGVPVRATGDLRNDSGDNL